MTATGELLKNAEKHAEGFDKGDLACRPPRRWRLWRAWTRA
jgi:hypothetical protein